MIIFNFAVISPNVGELWFMRVMLLTIWAVEAWDSLSLSVSSAFFPVNLFAFLSSNSGSNLSCKLWLDFRRVRLNSGIRQQWGATGLTICCTTMENFLCHIFIILSWVSNYKFTSSFLFRFVYIICLNCRVLCLRWLLLLLRLLYLLVRLHVVHRLGHSLVEILRLLWHKLWLKRCISRLHLVLRNIRTNVRGSHHWYTNTLKMKKNTVPKDGS